MSSPVGTQPTVPRARGSIRTGNGGGNGLWARGVNAVLAVWLFISAFVWPHAGAEQTNTWICAIIAFVVAIAAMGAPQIRYLNTLLGIWLFIGTLAFRHENSGTLWNNLIVACVIFLVSLVPSEPATGGHRLARV